MKLSLQQKINALKNTPITLWELVPNEIFLYKEGTWRRENEECDIDYGYWCTNSEGIGMYLSETTKVYRL